MALKTIKIQCKSLGFKYGKKDILHDISHKFNSSSFCAILGRNGSGKTTLLHCLNGINKPYTGEVLINGNNSKFMSQREIAKSISIVAQEHMEIFPFKVLDVVVMGRAPFIGMTSIPKQKDYELGMNALKIFNATKLANLNFNKISGGERQIAMLASALVQTNEIILLDEPTNHLDFNKKYLLLFKIKQLCKIKNTCVIASMHDPNLAMLFADNVILLKNGKILDKGPTKKIMTKHNIDTLYKTDSAQIDISLTKKIFMPQSVLK